MILKIPDNGGFPCKKGGGQVATQCGLRKNKNTHHKELIIATYEIETKQPCTAILDLQTFEWRKLKRDTRVNINETLRGYLIR